MQKSITDELREAIGKSNISPFRLEKESGATPGSVWAFMHEGSGLTTQNVDKLCIFLGLGLSPNGLSKAKSSYPGRGRPKKQREVLAS